MQYAVNITPNVRTRQETAGQYFLLMDHGSASGSIEVWLMRGAQELEYISTAKKGLKARMTGEGFTHIEFRATVATTAQVVISDGAVDFDLFDGSAVNATIVGQPVQVSNDRGTPGNLLYVSGVTLGDTPASSTANANAVACTDVAAVVAAADATRLEIRFCNLGPDPVAIIQGAGVNWNKRTIVLNMGDVWIEDRAAALTWSGICAAGTTANVTAQAIKG